ncbi:4,5-DOPA dioxygenase extradiol [Parasegetibacter sp. NRK P23]|uniref:4,5-DOPA-extradiol-dioxygenase n=1 Tax=Parasegetibacter sp. NRK P23 TaxID=2942999 RepID=UPI00204329E6|nr:4,5-DOPA dioxygenase extradiol [Parasegetibacter sp. NRK P23]
MHRKDFIRFSISGGTVMTSLSAFNKFTSELGEQEYGMPVLFIGHGSPMNGIEDNDFSRQWTNAVKDMPTPAAVLVVSAHWFTNGTKVTAMDAPPTIHDFGGFPKALFDVQYPAPGSPILAKETAELLKPVTAVELNHDWGLDHGTWTVIRHMYPDAKIPVLQLSIDYTKGPQYHYDLAKELYALRKKGVLIVGSGNMVHNLRMVAWDKMDVPGFGFDWALELNEDFKKFIAEGDHKALIQYEKLGRKAQLAIPTPEHYLPLMYTLGLKGSKDAVSFFNDKAVAGSLTMTSVRLG